MCNSGENQKPANDVGDEMLAWIGELFPICRSITGAGLRETLRRIGELIPLAVREVPSGTEVFDWTIPPEWQIKGARLISPSGKPVVDFRDSNLHVVNYSVGHDETVSLETLQRHLHSLPHQPTWTPYRTAYYRPSWGFCLPDAVRAKLQPGDYRVNIDASHDPGGSLSYGEAVVHGRTTDEILLTSHVCHPSLANDNLSAVAVACQLYQWIASAPRKYTYRFLFAPGTIGAVAWLAANRSLWSSVRGGFVLALLGDDSPLTLKRSRHATSKIDLIAQRVIFQRESGARMLPYTPTGYDERQFGSPGVDLPIARLSRSIEGGYAQYHTSADDLSILSADRLAKSLDALKDIVDCLEQERVLSNLRPHGEPQLGPRGLYPADASQRSAMLWTQSLTDGQRSLTEIAELSGLKQADVDHAAEQLVESGLLVEPTSERAGTIVDYAAAAKRLIPGGCHTYAKGDDQYPLNAPPCFESGLGCRVTAPGGQTFIEYGMGLRSVSLGHAYGPVIEAATKQMQRGSNFTRPAEIELQAASALLDLLPAAEMVKFAKNGSDATTAAIRLARAYTGRTKIVLCSDQPFFSTDDWFIGQTPMNAGVPQQESDNCLAFRYNDPDGLAQLLGANADNIACLIMEAATYEEPAPGYLQEVRHLCTEHGVVFILDEMITGFRWHIGGGQAEYCVQPDLSTFGKALGNGFAVAALAGRRELMQLGGLEHDQPRVFLLSTTHGAETHSLAAAMQVIKTYRELDVVSTLYRQGARLRRGIESIVQELGIGEHFCLAGRDCNLIYVTKDQQGNRSQVMRTLLLQELIERSVIAPSLVVSYSHDDSAIDQTVDAFAEALAIYAAALSGSPEDYLRGRPSKPVFRKYN
ncbi:MAG: hypothetical protein Aurels2KO_01840 [Aureliella sp.]